MVDEGTLLNELEAFIKKRFSLILIPIRKFLRDISEEKLREAIHNYTKEVRVDIENILSQYKISAIGPTECNLNENRILNIGDCVEEIELSVLKPKLIKVIGKGKNGQEIVRHLKITDKGKLLLI